MLQSKRKILFVDDEPWFTQGLRDELEDTDFDVTYLPDNGSKVIDVLRAGATYDLIILDIMMPTGPKIKDEWGGRRTGLLVCEQIRLDLNLQTPILFLTVIEDETVHEKIRRIEKNAGQTPNIILKPISPLDFIEEIEFIIGTDNNGS